MDDLIYRNVLIDELKKIKFPCMLPSGAEYLDGIQTAVKRISGVINDVPAVNNWIPVEDSLPDMRTRVFVAAVRNRKHYPKDIEPSRMFIAMRIEMLSDGEWYWAEATDIYGHDGIGGMIALGGWKVVAWMPMPNAYEPPNNMIGD